jgi:hypothetical protein
MPAVATVAQFNIVVVSLDAVQLIGGAFGGAGVWSVFAPVLLDRRERRSARAEVFPRLADVERARWSREGDVPSFREKTQALRAAALIAGVRRDVVERYILLATVARATSEGDAELRAGIEEAGGIPLALGNLVTESLILLSDALWHPRRTWFIAGRRLRQSQRDEQALRANDSEWSPVRWVARDL